MDLTKIAESIVEVMGNQDWSGDNPYIVSMADSTIGVAYIYELRRGGNWITIMETKSDNPSLTIPFLLQKEDGRWKYRDGGLLKYGKSSSLELQEICARLQVAIDVSNPTEISGDKDSGNQ